MGMSWIFNLDKVSCPLCDWKSVRGGHTFMPTYNKKGGCDVIVVCNGQIE